MIQQTTALRKIATLKKRIWVIQGGQGAGKTFSILIFLIDYASRNSNKEIFIASEELSKMRITVIKDFVKILKLLPDLNIQFLGGTTAKFKNGSFIKFLGLDKEDIGKGLRSDVVFVNECNKIKFETYRELTSRAKKVILDFNPNAEFWVHTEIIPRPDAQYLELTFNDNEFLSDEEKNEILSYRNKGFYDINRPDLFADENIKDNYWANKWRVYGLGMTGFIDGTIFNNWIVAPFDESLPFIYVMDHGQSDPHTLLKFARKGNNIYVHELHYKPLAGVGDIVNMFQKNNIDKKIPIVSDINQNNTILRSEYGYNVIDAKKPPGSVLAGIRRLQDKTIHVTESSTNTIKELKNYIWLDKKGEIPCDNFNHTIDPIRYGDLYYDIMAALGQAVK